MIQIYYFGPAKHGTYFLKYSNVCNERKKEELKREKGLFVN
jgi:hypothetical protein